MNCPFNEEQLNQLKAFVEFCKDEPQIVHHPKLAFFKEYLSGLGVTIPGPKPSAKNYTPSGDTNTSSSNVDDTAATSSGEESAEDSDVELDMEGVKDADKVDDSQVMGDETKEVTDEERDQSDEKRSEAMKAFSKQQYDEAIKIKMYNLLKNKVNKNKPMRPFSAFTTATTTNGPQINKITSNKSESSIMNFTNLTWSFQGSLEIRTRKPIETFAELLELMGIWIDEYEGPSLKRQVVGGVLVLLMFKLHPVPSGPHSNNTYTSSINQRITFSVIRLDFKDIPVKFTWSRTRGYGQDWFKITYTLDISSTKREGESCFDL